MVETRVMANGEGDQVNRSPPDLPDFDWDDVIPLYQAEDESAVVKINYSKEFMDTYAYLRGLMKLDEHSKRALALTKHAAFLNPANYTVWQYRRNIIKALPETDIYEELRLTREVIQDDPKNYQVWHHRQQVLKWMSKADGELDFINSVLDDDSKNYHAWQHRHWVVTHFKLWEGQLELSALLISADIRNNSAWNYRYFVISNTTGFTKEITASEITFTMERIQQDAMNESAWNYLNGIVTDSNAEQMAGVLEMCEELYGTKKCRSPYLISFMADKLTEINKNVDRVTQLYDELLVADPVRREYWLMLKRGLMNSVS